MADNSTLLSDLEAFMSDMDKGLDLPVDALMKKRRSKSDDSSTVLKTKKKKKKPHNDSEDDMSISAETTSTRRKSKKKTHNKSDGGTTTEEDDLSIAESTMTKRKKKKKKKNIDGGLTDSDDLSIAESTLTKRKKKKKKSPHADGTSTDDEDTMSMSISAGSFVVRRKKKKRNSHTDSDDDLSLAESTLTSSKKRKGKKNKGTKLHEGQIYIPGEITASHESFSSNEHFLDDEDDDTKSSSKNSNGKKKKKRDKSGRNHDFDGNNSRGSLPDMTGRNVPSGIKMVSAAEYSQEEDIENDSTKQASSKKHKKKKHVKESHPEDDDHDGEDDDESTKASSTTSGKQHREKVGGKNNSQASLTQSQNDPHENGHHIKSTDEQAGAKAKQLLGPSKKKSISPTSNVAAQHDMKGVVGSIQDSENKKRDGTMVPLNNDTRSKIRSKSSGEESGDDTESLVSEARSLRSRRQQGMIKLKFEKLPLYGREQEKLAIQNAIRRVGKEDAPAEVMMVLGNSGAGKTSLVFECIEKASDAPDFFFGAGKFDQSDSNNKPYAAFADAVTDLCGQVMDHPLEDDICEGIRDALGDEFFRLTRLIPKLGVMIDAESEYVGDHEQFCLDLNSFKRLLYLFRTMLRKMGKPNHPVIVFLDDIQWAEFDSLALFQYLANDDEMKNVLLIGSYQDYAIDRDHPLSVMLEEIDDDKLTLLRLDNLDENQVNAMLATLLNTENKFTTALAKIVHKKTKGNCFYINQFLELIQEHDFLRFSTKTKVWEWNLHKIKTETSAVGNVTDCIVARTQLLPDHAQFVLKTAASLGSTVDIKFVSGSLGQKLPTDEEIFANDDSVSSEDGESGESRQSTKQRYFHMEEFEKQDILSTVRALTKLGFLKRVDGTLYRFMHDTVQEAAYALIPGNDRDELHWKMGTMLKDFVSMRPALEEGMIFAAAVDQLNRGSMCMTSEKESVQLAALNLKAGLKAKEKLAFFLAADYAKAGLMFLDNNRKWSTHKDLAMELCLLASETALCCDDESECLHITKEIIQNSNSIVEQVPAFLVRMRMMGQRGRYARAVKEGLRALNHLDEKFPSQANPGWMFFSLVFMNKRDAKERSGYDLLNLPRMSDDKKLAAMKILALTVFFATRAPDEPTKQYTPLLYYRMLTITLRYGICSESVLAFGGYAVVVGTILGDHVEAFRFGNLAQQLQLKLNATKYMARATILEYGYTHHLKMPVRVSLDPLEEAFRVAMAHGGNEDAMVAASFYAIHSLHGGMPLGPLSQQLREYLELMNEYTRDTIYRKMAPLAQFVDNLMGKCVQPLVLMGDIMDERQMIEELKNGENPSALRTIFSVRFELAYWFHEHSVADHFLTELQKLKEDLGAKSSLAYRREIFFEGLTHLALARKVQPSVHKKAARRCIEILETFVENGAVDCLSMLRILEAETLSLKRSSQPDDVLKCFEAAIKAAEKSGSLQNIGLANELAGIYLMRTGDNETAQSMLMQAHDVYISWNAYGKVNHMAEMHPKLKGVSI